METNDASGSNKDHIRSSFLLKLKTELWWPDYDRNEHFETIDDQSTPLTTIRCNLVGRGSSARNGDRIRSSFGIKTVHGLLTQNGYEHEECQQAHSRGPRPKSSL